MKHLLLCLLISLPCCLIAQIGIKAGVNFANITKASEINNGNRSGFHAGIFFGGSPKKILGSRTELLFSRQGYSYKTNTNTGNVNLDYIMLPELLAINISKYFQLQLGVQISYLLNAKADSSNEMYSSLGSYAKILEIYNRFDYGVGGGFEVHPFKGLLIGARANFSLNSLYKNPESYSSTDQPSFVPSVNVKNNLIQLFVGWRFGK